jgi:membrane fusion protein (multidrug efflux system)
MERHSHAPQASSSTRRHILLALAGMAVFVTIVGGVKALQIRRIISQHSKFQPPPDAVTSAKVSVVEWRDRFQTVGSCAATEGAVLRAEIAGTVAKVRFDSGARVNAGDVLVELDRRGEEADLKGSLARLELARQNLDRAQTLKSQSALSMATFQDAQAKLKQAESEFQSIKAVIAKKTVVAPFSGRLGIRSVNVGDFVAAGADIAPLQTLNPIFFNLSIPQQVAPHVKVGDGVSVSVDAFPGKGFAGTITAINPSVNEVTRNVQVQATLRNEAEELLPGMFGSITVELGEKREVITVPASSINYQPYGISVFVVEPAQEGAASGTRSVRQQIVRVGQRRGDLVAITEGLHPGDEVVTSGVFKLRPGAAVVVAEGPQVQSSEKPTIKDT